jgi:hypothetical protein
MITLPAHVVAFDFYTEPWTYDNFTVTATAQDGTTLSQTVNGNGGATGFGFFESGPGSITAITITSTDVGFAVGEFGMAQASGGGSVPESGSTWVYLVLGLLAVHAAQRYFRNQGSNCTM